MSDITCYVFSSPDTFYEHPGGFPCGNLNTTHPSLPCCGGIDICMTNNLCFHTYSGTGMSGYYVAGCTSGNSSDPSCSARCCTSAVQSTYASNWLTILLHADSESRPDVVWNSTSSLWQCCGTDSNNEVACESPTKDNFNAPAPESLVAYFTIPNNFVATSTSIVTLTSTSTSTHTTVASSSSPTSNSTKSSAGVSAGAAAGIGIGCAIAGICFILILVTLWRRHTDGQRKSQHVPEQKASAVPVATRDVHSLPTELEATGRYEI